MSQTTHHPCACGGVYRLENRRTTGHGPKHQLPVCADCGRVDA